MLGGLTRHMLPHLSRASHLHVNRPLGLTKFNSKSVSGKNFIAIRQGKKSLLRRMKFIGMFAENYGIETPLQFNDRKCSMNISFVDRHKVKCLM